MDGGVPLEHLISCVPGIQIQVSSSGVKKIQWAENKPPSQIGEYFIVTIMHWCDHVICDVTLLRTLKINDFILYLYYQRYLACCLFECFFTFLS